MKVCSIFRFNLYESWVWIRDNIPYSKSEPKLAPCKNRGGGSPLLFLDSQWNISSHFVSKRRGNNYLYSILIRTGNYSLLKSLERTVRIYETTRQCMCTEVRPEHLRRKGRVFIHSICGKWYPYDLGTHLKNKHKKGKKGTKEYAYVSATARSYW